MLFWRYPPPSSRSGDTAIDRAAGRKKKLFAMRKGGTGREVFATYESIFACVKLLGCGEPSPRRDVTSGGAERTRLREPLGCGSRQLCQCRRKTDATTPVPVDVVEEMRPVAAEVVDDVKPVRLAVVDDAKPVRLEVVDDAKPATPDVVDETSLVRVDAVEGVKPPPPPASATGATPVGESVVKNRWNGPPSPGGSALGIGGGDQTTRLLSLARANSASGIASIATDAAGISRLLTSGTQKSDAATGSDALDGFGTLGRSDAVRVGRGAVEAVAGLLAGASCRYGEKTSYGESDSLGPTSSIGPC